MTVFAALDTSIHVADIRGKCLWRGKVLTNPEAIAKALSPFSGRLEKVGLETGCWTTWLWHELKERGFPMACMDARQAHAALSVTMNKTDSNDARDLAHLLRTGLYREVRVKSWDDMRKRALLRARATMLRCALDLAYAIRSALRTFGRALATGSGNGGAKAFEQRVVAHLSGRPDLHVIVTPWRAATAILPATGRATDKPALSVVIERRCRVRLLATFTIKLHTWRGDFRAPDRSAGPLVNPFEVFRDMVGSPLEAQTMDGCDRVFIVHTPSLLA